MKAFIVFSIFILAFSIVSAQVTRISDNQSFSPGAVLFDFEGHQESALGGELFQACGITFTGSDRTASTIRKRLEHDQLVATPPVTVTVLSNEGVTARRNSESSALVVDFRYPLKRVLFWIGNGDKTSVSDGITRATLNFYDSRSQLQRQ